MGADAGGGIIRATAHNLRTPDWDRVSPHHLLRRIKRERREEQVDWKIVPWQRNEGGGINRSYLALSNEGGIYAIFIRKREA